MKHNPNISLLEKRKEIVIDWFIKNQGKFEYVNYNMFLNYFKENDKLMRTSWEYVYSRTKDFEGWCKDNGINYFNSSEIAEYNFKKDKSYLEDWFKSNNNYKKFDRLSFKSIEKYFRDNDYSDLLTKWCQVYKYLKQDGLIEWFNETGLKFYIQEKKDRNKIFKSLESHAKSFYKENGYTPGFEDLNRHGFKYVKYLISDGWNLDWRISNLNDFYKSINLPMVPSSSEINSSELGNLDIKNILDDVYKTYGTIPSLRDLKNSKTHFDFERYVRKFSENSESKFYESLWVNHYDESFFNLNYKKLTSLDGFRCESMGELISYNFRYINGIPNNPHVPYSDFVVGEHYGYISDNKDGDKISEIIGYSPSNECKRYNEYWNKINNKRKLCEENGLALIEIEYYNFFDKWNEYIDYLYELCLPHYPNVKKVKLLDVIKSQRTTDFLVTLFEFFNSSPLFATTEIKRTQTKEVYRFFMNTFGSIKKFREEYESGAFDSYKELEDYNITFDDKKYNRLPQMTDEEKIKKGLLLLSEFMTDNDLTEIPSSSFIESQPNYRVINDLFRVKNIWSTINKKDGYYYKLSELLGFEPEPNFSSPGWYENRELVVDTLNYIKDTYGEWISVRKSLKIKDRYVTRLWSYITQKCGGVKKFRDEYEYELKKIF